MRTPRAFPLIAILLLTFSLTLPAVAASEVAPGSIALSRSLLRPGDTLFVAAKVIANGNVTGVSFAFQGNSTGDYVVVSDNLTVNSTTYRVQRTFSGAEPYDHYVLREVKICDDDGCTTDSTNLTDGSGNVPRFEFAPTPTPGPADLVATGLSVHGNGTLYAGSTVYIYGAFENRGNGTAFGFTISLYVDNVSVSWSYRGALAPGESSTTYGTWTSTPGNHTVRLVVDDGNVVNESNEANNVLLEKIVVRPAPADLGVDIRSITHERLRTEAGDLPHPLPRHTIRLTLTNDGPEPVPARVLLSWAAQGRFVDLDRTGSIGAASAVIPAHGFVTLDHLWDPAGVVGDVTVHALVYAADGRSDPSFANNRDSMADFVIVGGLGGI